MNLTIGTRVFTIRPASESDDWLPEAAASRRWGVFGTIEIEHNSHGHTFEVRHEDGSIGWYEPHELRSEER